MGALGLFIEGCIRVIVFVSPFAFAELDFLLVVLLVAATLVLLLLLYECIVFVMNNTWLKNKKKKGMEGFAAVV